MRSLIICISAAAVLLTVNASADPATSAAPAAVLAPAPMSANDPNKMECRTLPAKTGSRLGGRRECRTVREWEDIRQQDAHELEKMQARDAMVRH